MARPRSHTCIDGECCWCHRQEIADDATVVIDGDEHFICYRCVKSWYPAGPITALRTILFSQDKLPSTSVDGNRQPERLTNG